MNIVYARSDLLLIGRLYDADAVQVRFDVREWLQKHEGGNFVLLHQRDLDEEPYPVPVTVDNGYVCWTVRSVDVEQPGKGKAQLAMMSGTQILHTEIWTTITGESLGTPGEEPEPYEAWVQQILQAANDAMNAKTAAEQAAGEAEAAAAQAQTVAENVVAAHDADPEAHEDIREQIGTEIAEHDADPEAHGDIRTQIGLSIAGHSVDKTAHKISGLDDAGNLSGTDVMAVWQGSGNNVKATLSSLLAWIRQQLQSVFAAVSHSHTMDDVTDLEFPVSSVNGQTGAVSLDAEDVGAATEADITAAVTAHDEDEAAHADIRTAVAGKLSDAPSDGKQYARKNGAWAEVQGGGGSGFDIHELEAAADFELADEFALYDVSGEQHLKTTWQKIRAKMKAYCDGLYASIASLASYRTAADQDVIDDSLSDEIAKKYEKAVGGIPKTDLASAVQTSLGLADTALQEHQSLSAYRTASAQDAIDSAQNSAINSKYSLPNSGIPAEDLAEGIFIPNQHDESLFSPVLLFDWNSADYLQGYMYVANSTTPVSAPSSTSYRAYGIFDVEPNQIIKFDRFKAVLAFYDADGNNGFLDNTYSSGGLHDGTFVVPDGVYKLGVNLISFGSSVKFSLIRETPSEEELKLLPIKIPALSLQIDNIINDLAVKLFAPLKGKKIVNFGDSIFGNFRDTSGQYESLSSLISKRTGATTYNCGFGGCRMAKHGTFWDSFSMYRLAYAVANNDFSLQDAAVADPLWTDMPSYYPSHLARLKGIDFSSVDVITIAFGTNDFTASVSLDNENNPTDTDTFAGALRYSIETILSAYPNIRVFICGQTYRFWMDSSDIFTEDSNTKQVNGVKLTDFVLKTRAVSCEYNLPFIDNYCIGIGKHNRSYCFETTDGTHPKLGGRLMIADNIVRSLCGTHTLPSKVSSLVNDSGYQTALEVQTAIENYVGVIEDAPY